MNYSEFLQKYNITDKTGRINSNLSRSKIYKALCADLLEATVNLPESISIKDRLKCVINNVMQWPTCETCGGPVKHGPYGFTPFCSHKCSHKAGSSTFTKAKETCLKKYGVINYWASKECTQKRIDSGGIGLGNPKIREKTKNTNLERYGVENVFAAPTIKEKIRDTHIRKYGGNYHTVKLGKKVDLLTDPEYCKELAEKFCLSTISEMLGVASNTIYKYFEKHGITSFNNQRSNQEVELNEFLTNLGIQCVVNDRTVIKPYEIDIFVPDKKIGFELNGLYWHSHKAGCQSGYHLKKLNLAASKEVQLIQIFESEWVLKNTIVKSRIKSILGINQTIGARECDISEINNHDKKQFLSQNHIQGDCVSSINLGLFFKDKLIGCATFGKSRFDKKIDFELLRFCTITGLNVVGGFNKLLKFFLIKHPNSSIVSYSDKRWGSGNLYKKNGFVLASTSAPSYYYFKRSSLVLENRQKYQKHKLKKLLPSFDAKLSEWENMKLAGFNKIYDCGTDKWILTETA